MGDLFRPRGASTRASAALHALNQSPVADFIDAFSRCHWLSLDTLGSLIPDTNKKTSLVVSAVIVGRNHGVTYVEGNTQTTLKGYFRSKMRKISYEVEVVIYHAKRFAYRCACPCAYVFRFMAVANSSPSFFDLHTVSFAFMQPWHYIR